MKKFVSTLEQTRNEGRVEMLLRLLERRFGPATAIAVAGRLRAATIAELDRYAERVLDAATVEAVFEDEPR